MTRPEETISRKGKALRAVFIGLSLIGLLLALELTRIYVMSRLDPAFHSACEVSDKINCLTVAQSEYAAVFGVPVSVWGIGAYLALIMIAAFSFSSRELARSAAILINLSLAVFAALTSAVLFYLSEFVLQVICPYCMGTYVINGVLLMVWLGIYWSEGGGGLWKRLFQALRSEFMPLVRAGGPAAGLALLIMALSAGAYSLKFGDLEDAPRNNNHHRLVGPGGLPVGFTEDGHPWIGAVNPALTIVEFSDYQCPFCRRAHAQARAFIMKYPDQIRLVHRHFPLDISCNDMLVNQMHSCACRFASYAVCAGEQGAEKFWEMNDFLYNQDPRALCADRATASNAVGLDLRAFNLCLDMKRPHDLIQKDIRRCQELGITGTPSFLFPDGTIKMGAVPEELVLEYLPSPGSPPREPAP